MTHPDSDMFRHPEQFAYGQLLRLLRREHRRCRPDESETDFWRNRLRVAGYLSLAFPPNDVAGLEILAPPSEGDEATEKRDRHRSVLPEPTFEKGEQFRLSATFMGLYGSASPLPTFYTEEILDDERQDHSAVKSFLDLLGNLFFIRYHQASLKYRLLDRIVSENDPEVLTRLYCLLGMGHEAYFSSYPEARRELPFIGLFSMRQRSASGLETYLESRFGIGRVTVRQCVVKRTPIPEEQRTRLGESNGILGEIAMLGGFVEDGMGHFSVELADLTAAQYHRFLPGRPEREELLRSVSLYAGTALLFDLSLKLGTEETEPARLGGGWWSELGCDASLAGEVTLTMPGRAEYGARNLATSS